ncbi:hypothetical protein V6N13_141331 [Hibiscus sabdariffa]|uniref:Uncharacterized protein n=1 Tax=Hibiscus sabdariffa TaxID=183260 RepID=A0ABR2P4M4_9ROSI
MEFQVSLLQVGSFRSVREGYALNLVETIKSNEGLLVNLSDKVFAMSYAITSNATFGEKCKEELAVVSEETKHRIHEEANRIIVNIVNDHKESREKAISGDVDRVVLNILGSID